MNEIKRPAITELALDAKVGASTGYGQVRDGKSVCPAKAKRIGIALHSFGYDPNTLARSLRVERAQTLVVLFPLVNSGFLGNAIRTIRFGSRHSGFTVMLPHQEDAGVQQEQFARLSGHSRWHPSCPAAEANVAQGTSNSW